ncbi:MAG: aspartate kinase [Nonlabens sp.]
MRVFKFGGASVSNALGVKNICQIIHRNQHTRLGVVVSAMGKVTNHFERVLELYGESNDEYVLALNDIFDFHRQVVGDLLDISSDEEGFEELRFRESGILNTITTFQNQVEEILKNNSSASYSFLYDQVVSYGELLSTNIIHSYLDSYPCEPVLLDARAIIRTDSSYRNATVNWGQTIKAFKEYRNNSLMITQGFIGGSVDGPTTTLGREGSDYSAAIMAYCLDAVDVTIWKDVPGVLNADPRKFENTRLLNKIPYEEAIELAFYGASVIHPKTLQPLQDKAIILNVKSYKDPETEGTSIANYPQLEPLLSCYILRENMVYLSISSKDFSFIGERNISEIFHLLSVHKMQVGLLQNSAISFQLCIEDKYALIDHLLRDLSVRFLVTSSRDVILYTTRHPYPDHQDPYLENKTVLLRQSTSETLQVIIKN